MKVIIIPACLLLFGFTFHTSSIIKSFNWHITVDTIPQTEVFNLKREDIYVVITNADSVNIRLKKGDSIMMTRATFDTLPKKVRKELSANNDGVFKSEQIESSYPGGPSAWLAYLNTTFKYPAEAIKNRVEGSVVVQFIVDDRGKVSGIEVVSGPKSGGLREETIRVIQKSGRWVPASWNGYKVTSYKKQPLTFKLNPQ